MFSRIIGALVRAVLVGILFAVPMFFVPGVAQQHGVLIFVLGLSALMWTFLEYASTYPSLIEFRDAPPFNRVRYLSILATIYLLSLIQGHMMLPTAWSSVVSNLGILMGYSLDFTGSPVRMMANQFPILENGPTYATYLASAGVAYLASLFSIAAFVVVFFICKWPRNAGPFNVWTNMPTFDPTTTTDVVAKLNRDARVNVILGFALPFMIPSLLGLAFDYVQTPPFGDPYLMIWIIAGWAFLPAGLIMRGVALSRVAQLIALKRDAGTPVDEGEASSVLA